MTTINSVTQLQALAGAHSPKPTQAQRGAHGQQPAQSQSSPLGDGDGDHGIEPGGGLTGQRINVKG